MTRQAQTAPTANKAERPVIQTGEVLEIALDKLKASPRNVRRVSHTAQDIEARAASIRYKGLLQPLVVEPEVKEGGEASGYYLVTIGEGRRQALRLLAKRKLLSKHEPVRCVVDTLNDPGEISLDENTSRRDQDPVGDLNQRNALFMRQPINGLDDLLYIVLFGAQPYVVNEAGGARLAELHEIFTAQGTTHLACRNADPAAAQGAFSNVLKSVAPDLSSGKGCKIAFADPVGMYFVSFQSQVLLHQGQPVPASWTSYGRGEKGLYQRLEFGPADDEPAFLDEVVIQEGATTTPIIGGYQFAKLIEVGPKVLVGPENILMPKWFVIPAAAPADCSEADVCSAVVGPSKVEYERGGAAPTLRGG